MMEFGGTKHRMCAGTVLKRLVFGASKMVQWIQPEDLSPTSGSHMIGESTSHTLSSDGHRHDAACILSFSFSLTHTQISHTQIQFFTNFDSDRPADEHL